jgi:rod shape-determining protein MreD
MAILLSFPILALLAVLQSSIVNDLTFLDGRPDLVLLAVIAWAVIGRHTESMILGLIGGLFLDLLSGFPLGVTAINLILVTFLVSFSEGRFWESHFLMPLGVALLSSIVFYVFGLAVAWILGQSLDPIQALIRTILPGTFLNLILILPATQLARGLDRAIRPPEVEI